MITLLMVAAVAAQPVPPADPRQPITGMQHGQQEAKKDCCKDCCKDMADKKARSDAGAAVKPSN